MRIATIFLLPCSLVAIKRSSIIDDIWIIFRIKRKLISVSIGRLSWSVVHFRSQLVSKGLEDFVRGYFFLLEIVKLPTFPLKSRLHCVEQYLILLQGILERLQHKLAFLSCENEVIWSVNVRNICLASTHANNCNLQSFL